ncbi:hypothetical protein GQX74_009849 [Glossina fuscipes]|nr:hypothetical protein GQX74_009849 [Glossina fuscipes]
MIIKTRRTREINLNFIRLRSIGCSVNLMLIAFSICPNSSRSRGKRNIEIAIPLRPARAVRPTRCIYSLGVRGKLFSIMARLSSKSPLSIRSASSTTRNFKLSKENVSQPVKWSAKRPGMATTIWGRCINF